MGDDSTLDRGEVAAGLSPVGLDVFDRALDAIDAAVVDQRQVYVGGTSRMTTLWEDLAKLHRILAVLDQEAGVVGLLDQDRPGTSVRLGAELPAGEDDLAVVSTPYEASGAFGRMGV